MKKTKQLKGEFLELDKELKWKQSLLEGLELVFSDQRIAVSLAGVVGREGLYNIMLNGYKAELHLAQHAGRIEDVAAVQAKLGRLKDVQNITDAQQAYQQVRQEVAALVLRIQKLRQAPEHPVIKAIDQIIDDQSSRFFKKERGIERPDAELKEIRTALIQLIADGIHDKDKLESIKITLQSGQKKTLIDVLGEHRNARKREKQVSGEEVPKTGRLDTYEKLTGPNPGKRR